MNNGPNLVSLLIIGGVAGASVFGLYLGYKAIFDKLENSSDLDDDSKKKIKKNLKEILESIPETGFDAQKTLDHHKQSKLSKGERTKYRTKLVKSKSSTEDNIVSTQEVKNKSSTEGNLRSTEGNLRSTDKELANDKPKEVGKKKVGSILVEDIKEKMDSNKLVIIKEVDKLPEVMNKKKLTTSNEEIETLMELPNINDSAKHAEALIENETIRTVDKVNLKKKKRRTRKKNKD